VAEVGSGRVVGDAREQSRLNYRKGRFSQCGT
jgi:hypothetical protein